MRILIVEDDADVAGRLQATLTSLGYEVAGVVADTDEAMRLALLETPDVVLLDTRVLESPAGLDVNTLLGQTMGIPVVHLTARVEVQAAGRGEESGYFGYVPEPFDRGALRAAIEVVSYRRRLEELLRADEGRFKGVLIGMAEAVVVTDPTGLVTFANPAAEKLWGQRPGSLTGRPVTEAVEVVSGTPRPTRHPVQEALTTGRGAPLPYDVSVRDVTGRLHPVDGSVSVIFGYGHRVTGSVLVLADATRRRASEEALREREARYRDLFTGDLWASFVLDGKGQIRDCSESFAGLLGVGSREGTQGRSIREFLPVPLEYEYVAARLKDSGGFPPHERALRRIDGAHVDVIMAMTVVSDEPLTVLARLMEITEHKRLQERREMNRRADAVGHLAGGIAQRLNNIFQVVRGSAELLGEELEASQDDLDRIVVATEQGARLVRSILAVGQRSILHDRLVEAGATLRDLLPTLGEHAGPGVLMLLQLAVEPLWVRADPNLIGEALAHLVDNAREAMRRGGSLSLTISSETVPLREEDEAGGLRAGSYVTIEVADSGVGMDEKVRARAMEPFFTTKPEAVGLGLTVALGLARQHGGGLSLASRPDRGTKATLYLPRFEPPPSS